MAMINPPSRRVPKRALAFLLACSCSANVQSAAFQITLSDIREEPNPTAIQRLLANCYEEHGIDAWPIEGGGVQFDMNGALSKEESSALAEECLKRAEAVGLGQSE